MRSTKPLLVNGRAVTPLRMRFEGARPVEIDVDSGAEVSRELAPRYDGAARSGEVAIVDGSGRIGLDTLFHQTLLDENAASHVAAGRAFGFLSEDPQSADRISICAVHTDFMIRPRRPCQRPYTRRTRPRGPRPRRNLAPFLAAPAAPPKVHADRSGRSTNATLARAKGGAELIRPRACFRLDARHIRTAADQTHDLGSAEEGRSR